MQISTVVMGGATKPMAPSSSETNLPNTKERFKFVLMRVVTKTTSRYGVALFLFCSSLWLLTQAFLALHHGCWIQKPKASQVQEKGIDCTRALAITMSQDQMPTIAEMSKLVADTDVSSKHLENNSKIMKENTLVERKQMAKQVEIFKLPLTKGTLDSTKNDNAAGDSQMTKSDLLVKVNKQTLGVTSDIRTGGQAVSSNIQSPNRTFIPYPQGRGKPALQTVPYQLPKNVSDLIVKLTPQSWETMGCVVRVTLFTPSLNYLPMDYKWKELTESFKKYRLGYYFLKCPFQVCDLMIRVGTSADVIVNGGAVLVGATAKTMKGKVRTIMEDVKRKTPDNLLKIYLFALDNSLMLNYYDPYMANFEYHYSMTYHSRADVPIPFGQYVPGINEKDERNWAEGKTRLIAWVEDNCDKTFWPRLEYVKELSKYMPVDMYGKCGNLICNSIHCVEELKQYKFYLALEEAPCDEFITLHFWERGLGSGAVPIVYGGRKRAYKNIAPPNSFIHISDFQGPADLADYLLEVSKADWEYNYFHKWRTQGSIETSAPGFRLESLCHTVPQLIHQSPPDRKVMSGGKFYRSCRKGIHVKGLAGQGDLQNWSPWKGT